MWYYLTKYSFDADKPVTGPFPSEEDGWAAMMAAARQEYKIDTEENGWRTRLIENKECGEIIIKNFFTTGTDVTEFILFEIR